MLASVRDWALPKAKVALNLSDSFCKDYLDTFCKLYSNLPRQIIHRDPNPGNIIICGYDSVVHLTDAERQFIPYVILANQFVCVAWFSDQDKHAEIYETNKCMTVWLIDRFEELKDI